MRFGCYGGAISLTLTFYNNFVISLLQFYNFMLYTPVDDDDDDDDLCVTHLVKQCQESLELIQILYDPVSINGQVVH